MSTYTEYRREQVARRRAARELRIAPRPKTHRRWAVATRPKHTRVRRTVRNKIAAASRRANR